MDSVTEGSEDNEGFEIGWNRIFVPFVAFCKNLLSLRDSLTDGNEDNESKFSDWVEQSLCFLRCLL